MKLDELIRDGVVTDQAELARTVHATYPLSDDVGTSLQERAWALLRRRLADRGRERVVATLAQARREFAAG